jgi:hypothetical protein
MPPPPARPFAVPASHHVAFLQGTPLPRLPLIVSANDVVTAAEKVSGMAGTRTWQQLRAYALRTMYP